MPLLETKGAASAQGFGLTLGGAAPVYIEDVFSTWLYTGNGSTQTITNGIDVTGKGGLIWFKERASQGFSHALVDTARGNLSSTEGYSLASDTTNSQSSVRAVPTSSGFSLSGGSGVGPVNFNGSTYVSWTFRKQPKFFDVVTWTGNGANPRQIAHNLGSVPGCIIVKSTTRAENWTVYHRSLGNAARMALNTTDAQVTGTGVWASTTPTSTYFTVSADNLVNFNGDGYVAYIFAHNAGGFGLTGTDSVISCGSYSPTAGASSTFIDLGWEPQWVLIKNTNISGSSFTGWGMFDNMRGVTTPTDDQFLLANSSNAESNGVPLSIPSYVDFNATGFTANATTLTGANGGGHTYIYIAIRRGPMKTPTSGTSVFYPQAVPQGNTINSTGVPFPPDLVNTFSRNGTDRATTWQLFNYADRLRGLGIPNNTYGGSGPVLTASGTAAEATGNAGYVQLMADSQNITRSSGWNDPQYGSWIYYFMRRAPGFMDIVCYTGNDAGGRTIPHNLGVAPEMMFVKCRSAVGRPFGVYSANVGAAYAAQFDSSGGFGINASYWNNTNPTSAVFTVGTSSRTNTSGETYVAYLFASCPGVSKVGSYTGTGALQTINCGFTGGARWVMIKRSDSTGGDWYVYDSARGITSGNDPYLLLNSNAAEVTGTNYVDTTSVGFQVTAAAPAGLNASGGSYIFLAIA